MPGALAQKGVCLLKNRRLFVKMTFMVVRLFRSHTAGQWGARLLGEARLLGIILYYQNSSVLRGKYIFI